MFKGAPERVPCKGSFRGLFERVPFKGLGFYLEPATPKLPVELTSLGGFKVSGCLGFRV